MLVFGGVASAADDASPHQASSFSASSSRRLQPAFANDLWELDVGQRAYAFAAHAGAANRTDADASRSRNDTLGAGWAIPEGGVAFVSIDVNETDLLLAQRQNHTNHNNNNNSPPFGPSDPRSPADLCIVAVAVAVTVQHPCTRQLELVLFGPGPGARGDANHEPSSHAHATLLFDRHDGTANSG